MVVRDCCGSVPQDLLGALDDLRREQPLSFCLNDDVDDFQADGWMWGAVRTFLAERLPTPSPWEL